MLEMVRENNETWVRCKNCGHKLFKIEGKSPLVMTVNSSSFVQGLPKYRKGRNVIEIKCHSCKAINLIDMAAKEEETNEEK